MANEEHLALLRRGVKTWNEWRKQNPGERPDLRRADLSGADLSGADLREADLSKANLSAASLAEAHLSRANLTEADLGGAHLWVADLSGANLSGANLWATHLSGADLSKANLSKANLSAAHLWATHLNGADLNGADLSGANLSGANLSGANLSQATLYATTFGDVDLSEVAGLDTVSYRAPSTIGIDTIYKSEGKIPDVFLRGAGVPESFITYVRSLVMQPIQYQSCFISYSTKDEEFARRLHSRMQSEQLRVWFAPEDVQGGKKLDEQIDRAIQVHDRLLLVLSENSIRSEWVMTEIRKARKAEVKEKRRKLFPIRLIDFETLRDWECFDADTGKDMAVEVREYFITDFSEWKTHDKFETAFANLLRDLKKEEESPVPRTEA